MNIRMTVAAAAVGLALGLSACETATPYQPLSRASKAPGGFTDQKLDADHYRVTFQGNTLTARATVENYLLYRAAELTVAQGFDWFETVERHTQGETRTYSTPSPYYGGFGYWHPYWRYYGGYGGYGGRGWRGWDPFWGDPFWGDSLDVQTVEKFETTAEIVVHHGPKPMGEAKAFDAHEVISNLGPKIQRPA